MSYNCTTTEICSHKQLARQNQFSKKSRIPNKLSNEAASLRLAVAAETCKATFWGGVHINIFIRKLHRNHYSRSQYWCGEWSTIVAEWKRRTKERKSTGGNDISLLRLESVCWIPKGHSLETELFCKMTERVHSVKRPGWSVA